MQAHPRRPMGRAFAGALLVSAFGHGLLAWWVVPRLGAVVVVEELRPSMEIVIVGRDALIPPVAQATPRQREIRGVAIAVEGAVVTSPTPPPPSRGEGGDSASGTSRGEGGDSIAAIVAARRERAIAEAISPTGERLVPWRGATGTPGGPRSPTDSIDGRPRLGSGEPGDPRIPGSGNVDIAKVVARDGVVAQAQERARQGQVHPFLGAVKDRVEECWLPVAADADSIGRYMAVEDGVCAKGYHLRHNVGRVYAIYDPAGTRVAIELDTGHDGAAATLLRRLRDRVQHAFDEAGMRDVPPELLDKDGLLRVAWNVYIDDYRDCDLQGRGANAHKPGGDEIIGIVELDGLY